MNLRLRAGLANRGGRREPVVEQLGASGVAVHSIDIYAPAALVHLLALGATARFSVVCILITGKIPLMQTKRREYHGAVECP